MDMRSPCPAGGVMVRDFPDRLDDRHIVMHGYDRHMVMYGVQGLITLMPNSLSVTMAG